VTGWRTMFKKVLIANRGEIAVRIIRTCREMGIETVALYSEADKGALHVIEADKAIPLGGSEPSESYLNSGKILEAARSSGAEAIHPGYGFLAENAQFAGLCEKSGVVFIGPPSSVVRDLGSKTTARRIMEKAGVPVIPGMLEATTDPGRLCREAERIGYPVLIKAAAGGGGKGMRIVPLPGQDPGRGMEEACLSAVSEAEKAFGDGSLYLEKCLESPRHIEFQILADHHGHVVHLFERECSIQRRYQKIIEETPSPALTPALREAMGEAAVAAARASGYTNAGTVEFLLDSRGQFYFLEVNTRLQVEHPVTEMTTGIDLVRQQLEIACGRPLPFGQGDLAQRGHAMECRIYAEDPEAGFFPSPGPILLLREPAGPWVRTDSGIHEGFEVPVEYDPILSKLIVLAEGREAARRRMIRALESYVVLGIKTTIPFLVDIFRSSSFAEGRTHTDFIERHFANWSQDLSSADLARIAYVLEECTPGKRQPKGAKAGRLPTPWETLGEFRV
jgi:acetyl-CoA carboxylase, biotin carboxylase subunit